MINKDECMAKVLRKGLIDRHGRLAAHDLWKRS